MQMTNDTDAKQPAIPRQSRISRRAPWIAGILFFGTYAATAAPSIAALFDDSLEFQLVLPTFGIAHPTGYPLYTLGGWAWFHGLRSLLGQHANPTAILSAYSTLWALLALWLLYQLIVDLTGNWGIGLLLGCLLYTSDAADDGSRVDLGGRRLIKKKKKRERKGSG